MLASNILSYGDFLKDAKEPIRIRLAMVKRYREIKNISLVAKEFQTTRKTVRKWIARFSGTMHSLSNHSKAPKSPHRYIQERTEQLLVQFRKQHPSLGYDYIHHYLIEHGCDEIPSKSTCYAIWRKYDLFPKSRPNMRRRKISEPSRSNINPLKRYRSMLRSLEIFQIS